jgi:hypothetical protein
MRGLMILAAGLLIAFLCTLEALHDTKLRLCAAEKRLINAEIRALTANQRLAAYTLEDWRADDDRTTTGR